MSRAVIERVHSQRLKFVAEFNVFYRVTEVEGGVLYRLYVRKFGDVRKIRKRIRTFVKFSNVSVFILFAVGIYFLSRVFVIAGIRRKGVFTDFRNGRQPVETNRNFYIRLFTESRAVRKSVIDVFIKRSRVFENYVFKRVRLIERAFGEFFYRIVDNYGFKRSRNEKVFKVHIAHVKAIIVHYVRREREFVFGVSGRAEDISEVLVPPTKGTVTVSSFSQPANAPLPIDV